MMVPDNTQHNARRYTMCTITLETYGTDSQRLDTIERVKEELALQGFNISHFSIITSGVM